MATANIGINQGLATLPYAAATKKSKELDISAYVTPSTGTVFSKYVFAKFEADSTGKWRMIFNASIYFTGNVNLVGATIAFTGITFKNNTNLCAVTVSGLSDSGAVQAIDGFTNTNSSNINLSTASTGIAYIRLSGEVPLESEPVWASLGTTQGAALEATAAVEVYIPAASAGVSGLINNTSGNTVGNPIKGRTDGGTVADGYIGQKFSFTSKAAAFTTAGYTATTTLGTLPAGTWQLFPVMALSGGAGTTGVNGYISIDGNNADTGGITTKTGISDPNFGGVYPIIPDIYVSAGVAIYAKGRAFGANQTVTFSGYAVRIA